MLRLCRVLLLGFMVRAVLLNTCPLLCYCCLPACACCDYPERLTVRAICSPNCVSYILRKRGLYNDMSRCGALLQRQTRLMIVGSSQPTG